MVSGETRRIGKGSLVAKCLCTAHNGALSPLDAAAGKFFTAIAASDRAQGTSLRWLFNGHDLERWFLKTMLAMASSHNLASDGERLAPTFDPRINIPAMLQDHESWPLGAGLYFTDKLGHAFSRADDFQLAPLTQIEGGTIAGMLAKIQGMSFTFLAVPPQHFRLALASSIYRPGELAFDLRDWTNVIQLCWRDRRKRVRVQMTMQEHRTVRLS